jgi:hypothetical protein
LTLWVLKWVEDGSRRERRARIAVEVNADGPAEFRPPSDNMTPGVINNLERRQGVVRVEWRGGD